MKKLTIIPKPIRSKEELDAAFARIDELIDAQPGTSEGD